MSEQSTGGNVAMEVTETELLRDFWASRPWFTEAKVGTIKNADVVVVPWMNFRVDHDALFPEGTSDVVKLLKRQLAVEVAVDRANYLEIALYADAWRLPTMLCNVIVVPLLVNLLAAEIDRRYVAGGRDTPVAIELLVEGGAGRCVSIKYKGPAAEMPKHLLERARNCFPEPHVKHHPSMKK